MPLYEFKCGDGHITDRVFRVREKPSFVQCLYCRRIAQSIISKSNISQVWPEGRQFLNVHEERAFKNYRELDKHLAKSGDYVEQLSTAQLKRKREERTEKLAKGLKPTTSKKRKKFDFPDSVKRAMVNTNDIGKIDRAMKEAKD